MSEIVYGVGSRPIRIRSGDLASSRRSNVFRSFLLVLQKLFSRLFLLLRRCPKFFVLRVGDSVGLGNLLLELLTALLFLFIVLRRLVDISCIALEERAENVYLAVPP